MEDKVFGTLTFRVGWVKNESFDLWGNHYQLRVRTSSKKDQQPTATQQNSYTEFLADLQKISTETLPMVEAFVLSNKEDIADVIGLLTVDHPLSLVTPKEVLFFQNGKYAIICDTKWSEAGMAILCDSGKYTVDESYILEFEY